MTQRFDIGCSPHEAFDGFNDPRSIVEWWGDPAVYRTKSWTSDLREGGRWRAEFEAPDGTSFGAEGEYLSIDRPANLEWTWKADWEPEVEKTIRMMFKPSSAGTELVIETTGCPSEEAEAADEAAWVGILGWLNRTIGKSDG